MKNIKKKYSVLLLIVILCITSCKDKNEVILTSAEKITENTSSSETYQTTEEFKDYWYKGEAEISSYKLEQSRYGEIHDGTAVLIYVTEPFLENEQVKADRPDSNTTSVLKLNATKKFFTGIYPYSIMQSTFYPIGNNRHALKVSSSIQEWCGHTFMQLNNRELFEVKQNSYFQSEGDKNFNVNKAILENEIWTQLRINPLTLPVGKIKVIPSLEFINLNHMEVKAYDAIGALNESNYTLDFPNLNRKLVINFSQEFPHEILSWEESLNNQVTTATQLKTIKSPYWNKKKKKDSVLRESLQLN